MSKIVFCNNEIKGIKYSGFTITKVYACGGEVVYDEGNTSFIGRLALHNDEGDNFLRTWRNQSNSDVIEVADLNGYVFPKVSSTSTIPYTSDTAYCTVTSSGETIGGFQTCDVVAIKFPEATRTVNTRAFYDSRKALSTNKVLYLNDGLKTIEPEAFCGWSYGLKYVAPIIIPSTVTSIGYDAFEIDGSNIGTSDGGKITLMFKGSVPPTLDSIFGSSTAIDASNAIVYVPQDSLSVYRAAFDAMGHNYTQVSIYGYTVGDNNYNYIMYLVNNALTYWHLL